MRKEKWLLVYIYSVLFISRSSWYSHDREDINMVLKGKDNSNYAGEYTAYLFKDTKELNKILNVASTKL